MYMYFISTCIQSGLELCYKLKWLLLKISVLSYCTTPHQNILNFDWFVSTLLNP